MFPPGTFILGNTYRIEQELGRGAFGVVYRATHLALNVKRAIKVLHANMPGVGSTVVGNYRNRFQLEAQLAAQLTHSSHIIQVYDFLERDGVLYCVMEYAPGGSLADLLRREGLLPVDRVVQLLAGAARGLDALHEINAVHRDVKPPNILLDRQGHAKVADLGLAQTPGPTDYRAQFASLSPPHPGTPEYSSPEHKEGSQQLEATADVYSLGCVAFELLTGKLWKSSRRKAERPSDLRADVPAWLDAVVERMLCETPGRTVRDRSAPARRYVDMVAVLEALDTGTAEQRRQAEQAAAEERKRKKAEAVAEQQRLAEQRAAEERKRTEAEAATAAERKRQEAERKRREAAAAAEQQRLAEQRSVEERRHKEAEAAAAAQSAALERLERLQAQRQWDDAIEAGNSLLAQPGLTEHMRRKAAAATAAASSARGRAAYDREDYAAALADETRAIELDPNNADYYNSRSSTYWKLGNYSAALTDCNEALRIDPRNAKYVEFRQRIERQKAEVATQERLKRESAEQKRRQVEKKMLAVLFIVTLLAGGYALYSLLRSGQAVVPTAQGDGSVSAGTSPVPQAPTDSPQDDAATVTASDYAVLAFTAYQNNDYADAVAYYTRAIELDPDNADYYYSRGVSYHQAAYYKQPAGDYYGKAIADATRAIELDPNNADYYYIRGVSYHQAAYYKQPAGDYAKSITDATRAITLDPDNAAYYYSRSITHWNLGNYTAALVDCNTALRLEPGNVEYFEFQQRIKDRL